MFHQRAFDKHVALKQKYGDNAYMLWALGLYLDESDLDALAGRSLTDGGNDKCIDFLEIDKSGQKIVIAQGYFTQKTNDKAPSKKASDMNIAAAWLAAGAIDASTVNERVRSRIQECRTAIAEDEIEQIELLYIHNLPESLNTQEELDTCRAATEKLFSDQSIEVSCRELGLKEIEALHNERSSQIVVNDDIVIEGKKLGGHETPDWSAHMFTVNGLWLHDLFKSHDDKLFSANYRGFLGINKKKKINSGIRNTAEKQPSDFWVFNNGVTLLTKAIVPKGRKHVLKGISIINGAQTTGSLGSVDTRSNLDDVRVMCRVVVCKNPEKIDEIVKYNNTQNKITTWDQYSNDETQILLKKQFADLGYDYSMKRGFDSADSKIGIEKAAQPTLAFNGHYADANRSKNSIFQSAEIYRRAFSDRSARHILLAYCFSRSIDELRASLRAKTDRTDSENKQLSLFNYFSFKPFLLASIGATLEQFLGKQCTPDKAKFAKANISQDIDALTSSLDKITRQVLRAVAREIEEATKRDSIEPIAFLKNELSLPRIQSGLNSFLESILDGNLDSAHASLISVEN